MVPCVGKQGRAEPQHHHEPGEVDCVGQESIGTLARVAVRHLDQV